MPLTSILLQLGESEQGELQQADEMFGWIGLFLLLVLWVGMAASAPLRRRRDYEIPPPVVYGLQQPMGCGYGFWVWFGVFWGVLLSTAIYALSGESMFLFLLYLLQRMLT
jgi:hypothetical protein